MLNSTLGIASDHFDACFDEADLLTVKRHGGWKSNTVEGGTLIDLKKIKKVATKILGEIMVSATCMNNTSL